MVPGFVAMPVGDEFGVAACVGDEFVVLPGDGVPVPPLTPVCAMAIPAPISNVTAKKPSFFMISPLLAETVFL